MTPNEAKQEDNKLKVWLNISNKAEFNRKYPPLSVGSFVRIYEPPKHKKKVINLFGVQEFTRLHS